MTDERTDDRLKKEPGVARVSRAASDRKFTEDRTLNDDERLEMFRQQMFNDALPNLPDIPGYHTIWLTTTNPRDTIHMRTRLGYELIRSEDIPGFESITLKTGEYSGHIGINEMVAAKLPMSLYQAFMREAHHNEPQRQADALNQAIEAHKANAERDGGRIDEGDGIEDLRRSAPAPTDF